MVVRKLALVSSSNSNSLVIKYNRLIESADKAYSLGLQDQASHIYLQAFDVSIQLLCSPSANRLSARRVADICNNCFDYCPILEDTDETFYLETAAEALENIIKNGQNTALRKAALHAYKIVACLACELVRFNQSIRCQVLIDHYIQVEHFHSKYLAN
ncbi:hypothetical protein L1286_06135 [Pseudoalteromonas sp. SMS1]|uniref:hypothetical protein n=1 Tax=Pseudoalteromonas sp. SMS1 TaxID=2908894 RepID=UPI001F3F9473|nr:hypothetical protein [Pseudoalteromonas sp. SMS1]MCF2857038.1 hypothetical protein [Pseudoalteromonas sp. SMS1]